MTKNDFTDGTPETPPPPPGPDEAPLPEVPPAAFAAHNLTVISPAEPQAPDGDLEAAILHELDEAAQAAYAVYADKLYEHGELQATQWAGLNEALRSAWRAAVKYVRDQEELTNASR